MRAAVNAAEEEPEPEPMDSFLTDFPARFGIASNADEELRMDSVDWMSSVRRKQPI